MGVGRCGPDGLACCDLCNGLGCVWSPITASGNPSHARAFRPCRFAQDLDGDVGSTRTRSSSGDAVFDWSRDYPPPDPSVGGGEMAWLSPLYSRRGIDLGSHVHPLPEDGVVPSAPGWRWIHTPGHAPGHVSFFRDADRVLIAGDAFVTTKQESLLAALLKPQVVHGPPAYFTTDWSEAEASVRRLAQLCPETAATGHGVPMHGQVMRRQLGVLSSHFNELAVPSDGRYVRRPLWRTKAV